VEKKRMSRITSEIGRDMIVHTIDDYEDEFGPIPPKPDNLSSWLQRRLHRLREKKQTHTNVQPTESSEHS